MLMLLSMKATAFNKVDNIFCTFIISGYVDKVVMMEQWQKQWILSLMGSCNGNRLLAAKRMSEISRKEIRECWQLLDEVIPMSTMERLRYCSLGIMD